MTAEWVVKARELVQHFERVSAGEVSPPADMEHAGFALHVVAVRALLEIAAALDDANQVNKQALGLAPVEVEGRIPCPLCGGSPLKQAGCHGCNGNGFVYFPPAAPGFGAAADATTGAAPADVPGGAGPVGNP